MRLMRSTTSVEGIRWIVNTKMESGQPRGLGTFGGVFVPNVLTILGVIMFLRTGWVVGSAGILAALTILVVANVITLLTTLSLSAIATNTRVGVGGAYFLISRSLGLEIGGSIGVPLFFAQAISVAFYLVGFAESLRFIWPSVDVRAVAGLALIPFFCIAWFGASIVARLQNIILLALLVSLVSFFMGYSPTTSFSDTIEPHYAHGQGFWSVFAIFFPAVTGIMAGVSMSGDLKNPSQSIPRGTLAAVLVTFTVYAAQILWLGFNADRDELLSNNLVMHRIARFGWAIYLGLWAATLSSALASLAAAPRTLQALGTDRVVPRFLGRGFGPTNEPRTALFLTTIIAAACVLLGDLDVIAPVITMFFLATYGTVSFVAGLENLVGNPSYRPTYKVHWLLSMLGCIGCFSTMMLINVWATLIAMVFILGIYVGLTRVRLQTNWGDMRSGMWFALTRFGLLRFQSARQHHRNWRPVILVLCGNPKVRLRLVEFAQLLEARRGLLLLAQIATGEWDSFLPRLHGLQSSVQSFIQENRVPAVGKTIIADDFEQGVLALLQVGGLGYLEPNTVLLGWSGDELKEESFTRSVRRILQLEKDLIIYVDADEGSRLEPYLDVWWYARHNGSLMVTLAHLINSSNFRFREHTIRVRRVIQDQAGFEEAHSGTIEMLESFRVNVEVDIIVSTENPLSVIAERSRDAEVTFVGIAVERLGDQDENHLGPYTRLAESLHGNLLLCKSWQDLSL